MQPKNKNTLRAYFTFSIRERKAIYLLLVLTILFFLLPHLFPYFMKPDTEIFKDSLSLPFTKSNPKIFNDKGRYKSENKETKITKHPVHLFYFDPNTATLDQWQKLGVREKTAETILKYTARGGRFKTADDLKKIWGLPEETAQRLIPFVKIAEETKKNKIQEYRKAPSFINTNHVFIDVNLATHQQWELLKGIGPGLASRIIKFREKLGGFISAEQVKETYGLPDTTFLMIKEKLIFKEVSVKKLNINVLGVEELAKHPYIRFKVAKAIVAYRDQHGAYSSVQELEKVISISSETFKKMEKYLTAE
jgi:competence protein ComEA